ncbi:nucleotide-diphospho-sugar transferase [Zychaea mexicana]|uniref:nucleotide-diphospho-sugar transferase n=1 Tax=Zychaea mexicana TaxID=64656 RepID=UPI0022FF0322|nr:nucleotide-diphospho-sugar transferase [Zychaea mexicana]KAI9491559.1 nucleotide-diphospho-sugar transferase [Zychaea mexicana]
MTGPTNCQPKAAAWVLVLTSTNDYVKGAITVARALQQVKTQYPIVVLYTSSVSAEAQALLSGAGCILKQIEPIRPPGKTNYLYKQFVETWTKLAVWSQYEYERVVLLDADMLPLKNMDELMEVVLPDESHIAACHACTCNPHKIETYPDDWIPSNCGHTGSSSGTKNDYFNSGLMVLTPSQATFEKIVTRLYGSTDLTNCLFGDQDFLNEVFGNRWAKLPYVYNSLKTLPHIHSETCDLRDVKNIHYIMQPKPWAVDMQKDAPDEKEQQYYPQYQLWWDMYNSAGLSDSINKIIYG